MDILAMPFLALMVLVFSIYVWVVWLSDKNGRALNLDRRPEDDAELPDED